MEKKKKIKIHNQKWTIQLIPHGKGSQHSIKISALPFIFLISFSVLLLSGVIGYSTWTTLENDKLQKTIEKLSSMRDRNIQLEQEVKSLQLGLLDINESIESTRVWLESIDRMRTEIEKIENDIYNRRLPRATDKEVYKIVSMSNLQTTGLNEEDITTTIDNLIKQIDELMENASVRDSELEGLRDRYESSLEQLVYIPSINPASGYISSRFGYRRNPFGWGGYQFHQGVDIANRIGTNIQATANGTVVYAGRRGGYGLSVSINHGNGLTTTYSHMSRIIANVGDKVNRGDVIGKMGSTGNSTGVHVHYEIIKDGTTINPISYMKE